MKDIYSRLYELTEKTESDFDVKQFLKLTDILSIDRAADFLSRHEEWETAIKLYQKNLKYEFNTNMILKH